MNVQDTNKPDDKTNDQSMTHADWLRAIAAWVPDHADRLMAAADHIETLEFEADWNQHSRV